MTWSSRKYKHKKPKINKTVKIVNGFAIRNINPDFDILNWRKEGAAAPVCDIPADQIWLDERFVDEEAFLLKLYLAEQKYEADHGPNFKGSDLRAFLKKKLTWGGPIPVITEFTVRKRKHGRFLVRYVDGRIVREWIDPWFVFGGHSLIYDYIPCDEIWLDAKQHPREAEYTLAHEIREWWLMGRGKNYSEAHNAATVHEKSLRMAELISKRSDAVVLKMRSHHQEKPGSCGPASAKIMLDYFQKDWTEKSLRKLCGMRRDGTNHLPLVLGLQKTGAFVAVKSGGTIEDLKKFLKYGLPVMVGMWSPEIGGSHFDEKWSLRERKSRDCGHYSIVCGISDRHVTIMDPDNYWVDRGNKTGKRRLTIASFLEHWYDTDGPEYHQVKGWMLVINFSGRKFGGMKNYPPMENAD